MTERWLAVKLPHLSGDLPGSSVHILLLCHNPTGTEECEQGPPRALLIALKSHYAAFIVLSCVDSNPHPKFNGGELAPEFPPNLALGKESAEKRRHGTSQTGAPNMKQTHEDGRDSISMQEQKWTCRTSPVEVLDNGLPLFEDIILEKRQNSPESRSAEHRRE